MRLNNMSKIQQIISSELEKLEKQSENYVPFQKIHYQSALADIKAKLPQIEQKIVELNSLAYRLLGMAKCPIEDCDGHGNIPVMVAGARQIGDDEWEQTQEWGAEQCQWCSEREDIIKNLTS